MPRYRICSCISYKAPSSLLFLQGVKEKDTSRAGMPPTSMPFHELFRVL